MLPIKLKITAFHSNGVVPRSERARSEMRKKKLMSRVLILIGLLFTMTLLVKAFFGERGFIGLLKIKSEYASIYEEVHQLESENAKLMEEIDKLSNDKYYQEKLAREKMGFIREGEVVFLFPDEKEKEKESLTQKDRESDKNH